MLLRDHFRSPLNDVRSWDELHGQWPAVIVQQLGKKLPPRYIAAPRVHFGSQVEIDVAAYETETGDSIAPAAGQGNGAVATAVWAPARPTLAVETDLPDADEFEVRVYDTERGRRLVAAIEIVSPA